MNPEGYLTSRHHMRGN